ncbi:MAG: peptide chain release factor 1 [Verrucomicrobiota bacterium]|nr:peptide chain release factor 1 [Verrucomicrobiota bacterium]
MNFDTIIETFQKQFKELEKKLSDPDIFSRQDEFRETNDEYQHIKKILDIYEQKKEAKKDIDENLELRELEDDEAFQEEINKDIERLEKNLEILEKKFKVLLIPPDKQDSKDIIVEIRPAAGGDESALFAGNLFKMYTRYAENKGWKTEVMNMNGSNLGGIKEVVFSIKGAAVYKSFKFESGVHRVQRVPTTETSGRIHTSTVTCAVLPEVDDVEIDVKSEDLRIDVFRASGPGGQCVNTTDSAVRITHLPTGIVSISQQEKSQHKNKAMALRILKARILKKKQAEEAAKIGAKRKSQIGTGDRSERIRTYNFPQSRITDHRYNVTKHDLEEILEGNLDIILDDIITIDAEQRLQEEYGEIAQ